MVDITTGKAPTFRTSRVTASRVPRRRARDLALGTSFFFLFLGGVARIAAEIDLLIGLWQQESGKGPQLEDGATVCVPDPTPHNLSP